MTPAFAVHTTSHFDREFKKLAARHRELADHLARVVAILASDPYNQSRTHPIRKLTGIPAGQGQWRLRIERFRFRYDIIGHIVYLKACGLRSEATYGR